MSVRTSRVPLRLPFYYGWVMVGAYFLTGVAGGPGLWGFQVFVLPMTEELGWSRTMLYSALTLRTLVSGALAVFIGRLADKPRWPMTIMLTCGIAEAASFALLGLVQTPLQYFAASSLLGGIASSGFMMHQALVPKWFIRKRGRAVSMGSMGTAVSALVYPLFAQASIDAFGWRQAWLVMGISSFLLLVPISLLVRRQPEDVGLEPDGDAPGSRAAARRGSDRQTGQEYSFTVRQAVRARATWLIVAVTMLSAPTLLGLTSNWVPHFRDIGISAAAAASAVTVYGLFSIISRFVWGYFLDRAHVRRVAIVHGVLTAGAVSLLLIVTTGPQALGYAAVQGITLGGYLAIQPLIWANYFGRGHLGAIRGAFAPLLTLTSASAPVAIAAVNDIVGSYRPVFVGLLISWLICAALMFFARPLRRPDGAQQRS